MVIEINSLYYMPDHTRKSKFKIPPARLSLPRFKPTFLTIFRARSFHINFLRTLYAHLVLDIDTEKDIPRNLRFPGCIQILVAQ